MGAEMREQIAELNLRYLTLAKARDDYSPAMLEHELTNLGIVLLIEEIKKVRSENPYSADEDTDSFFAFDLACAKLLKRFSQ